MFILDEQLSWLKDVADAVRPGWNRPGLVELAFGPDVDAASTGSLAQALCAPARSAERRTYKAPPVPRLIKHQRIAFVGASNDQLAAALTVAHHGRGGRNWSSLEVFFLEREALRGIRSSERSTEAVLRARDTAVEQLRALLPVMAERWKLWEYDHPYYFGCYWDWDQPGGYIHVSPYIWGQDVRHCPRQDLLWEEGTADPGADYLAYAKGIDGLLQVARELS